MEPLNCRKGPMVTVMRKTKSDYIIQSVDHALNVLEQLKENSQELKICELSQRLNLHKNKVFRLLATLSLRDYIEHDKHSEGYRLGLKTLDLGLNYVNQIGFLAAAKPVQEALARKCHETTYISMVKWPSVVYLNAVETDRPVRVIPRIGSRFPFHCTEAGKIFAATLREEVLREYFKREGFKKFTPKTISKLDDLTAQLRTVAECGYAVDDEELEGGVKSVGAPFRDYANTIVGVLTISGPSTRMSDGRIRDELVPLLKQSASEISTSLGHW